MEEQINRFFLNGALGGIDWKKFDQMFLEFKEQLDPLLPQAALLDAFELSILLDDINTFKYLFQKPAVAQSLNDFEKKKEFFLLSIQGASPEIAQLLLQDPSLKEFSKSEIVLKTKKRVLLNLLDSESDNEVDTDNQSDSLDIFDSYNPQQFYIVSRHPLFEDVAKDPDVINSVKNMYLQSIKDHNLLDQDIFLKNPAIKEYDKSTEVFDAKKQRYYQAIRKCQWDIQKDLLKDPRIQNYDRTTEIIQLKEKMFCDFIEFSLNQRQVQIFLENSLIQKYQQSDEFVKKIAEKIVKEEWAFCYHSYYSLIFSPFVPLKTLELAYEKVSCQDSNQHKKACLEDEIQRRKLLKI